MCLLQLRVSAVDRLTASGASPTAETKNYGTLAAMFDRLLRTVPALWWLVLLLLSALLAAVLTQLRLPAGVLIACMVAGIVLSTREIKLSIAPWLFGLAQGVLGCLMARSLQPAVLAQVASDWPIFLAATLGVMGAAGALGWLLMRSKVLPGTTAVWGLAPGAASAMVLMGEAYGADVRLVAFMQYLRVVVVTAVASLVARLWTGQTPHPSSDLPWFAVIDSAHLGATVALVLVGSTLARRLHIPAGSMLVPLVVGMALQGAGVLVIELPPALLAVSYAVIGWSIGLRFTRTILLHALRALPAVLAAILALMAVGVAIAVALTQFAGFEPLTAYLASSPGGADSVAIIAATSSVDAGFVMALQLSRFLMVLAFGPQVSRFIATRHSPHQPPSHNR